MNAALGNPPARARDGRSWPILIVALLGTQMVFVLGMMYIAASDSSVGIEPQYYEKALHWDDRARQEQANQRLGWRISVDATAEFGGRHERRLTCRLCDRAGQPLPNAVVELTAFHNARSNDRQTCPLTNGGDGQYFADLPLQRPGLWEMRFTARCGAEAFTSIQQFEVASHGGAPQ